MSGQWQTDFINYLRFEKRSSPHTITAYQKDLDQFHTYLTQQFGDIGDMPLTHFHLRSWLADLKEQGLTARSINRKISSLQAFFRYLQRHQLITVNPARQLRSLRTPDRLPLYLREKEADYLLEELQFAPGFGGLTDRMICELLYQTGMRRSELMNLREQDIEWSLRQIRVLGKGNKERLIPMNEPLLQQIRDYLVEKRKLEQYDSDRLLVLENGKPLYAGYIYRAVKKYLSATTTLPKRSPHILRHSFATHLLSNGANIQAIKDLLGHSSLAATQVYTHNNVEQLREIHKKNHPRA
jgi:integrase/recombinase XerC